MPNVTVEELQWKEHSLGEIDFPKRKLELSSGFGSGLTAADDSGRRVWAISDRGPNLKIKDAGKLYGWEAPEQWRDVDGAKMMPRPDIGPSIALLTVGERSVTLERIVPLKDSNGRCVSGLPVPESGHAECEPVLGLDGKHLEPAPSGMDTEGIALLGDGSFWAGEEYGPSLVRIGADGEVLMRLVPEGVELPDAPFPVRASLPALASRRHLNRGFEALAAAPSGTLLYLAFQSPLAHPSVEDHEQGRHVRLWQLDSEGQVTAQFAYRFDDPETFHRDCKEKDIGRSDIKVCEIVALGDDKLLVLERASETSKIYRVQVRSGLALGDEHLDIDARPTLEQLSAGEGEIPELPKELLFSSDDWPDVGSDIEGVALLDRQTLLIVSDNDFGCEGKQTRFYRLRFDQPL